MNNTDVEKVSWVETKANAIAAAGLVKRTGDHFTVYQQSQDRIDSAEKVRRSPSGQIICSCEEFSAQSSGNSPFCCEHILAVKTAIKLKNTENYESLSGADSEFHPTTGLSAMNTSRVLQFSGYASRSINETHDFKVTATNAGSIEPVARTLHDLITGRQLALIRDFSRRGSVNAEKECNRLWGLMPGELSRSAASVFISYLSNDLPAASMQLAVKQAA